MDYHYVFEFPTEFELRGFERKLALLELQGMGIEPHQVSDSEVTAELDTRLPNDVLARLAFFAQIRESSGGVTKVIRPYQHVLDRSARAVKLALRKPDPQWLADQIPRLHNGRREHTYLTHSYHQYKGKYYPQLVKSLFNYAGVRPGQVVLDPFCGSGTTLVEGYLNDLHTVGVDMNPLAVLISRVKVQVLRLDPGLLRNQVKTHLDHIQRIFRRRHLWDQGLENVTLSPAQRKVSEAELLELSLPNYSYLRRWFEPVALLKIGLILSAARQIEHPVVASLAVVTLSNLVRAYSWQASGQLRVRRRQSPPEDNDILLRYWMNLHKNVSANLIFHAIRPKGHHLNTPVEVYHGDIRHSDRLPSPLLARNAQVDIVVTSPPYATALPYIDTDRLSLFLLGLLETDQRRGLERAMIGNREISDRERRELEQEFLTNYENSPLPDSVKATIREVLERNAGANVGFRRRNKAALLYKYFLDMNSAFKQLYRILKTSGLCIVVIGNSTTVAGGKQTEIRTDQLLMDISRELGFYLIHKMPMTDQAAYMAHSKNTIRTETIFILRK
jgi:DNA modification methylase